jgi:hypothetical protein
MTRVRPASASSIQPLVPLMYAQATVTKIQAGIVIQQVASRSVSEPIGGAADHFPGT